MIGVLKHTGSLLQQDNEDGYLGVFTTLNFRAIMNQCLMVVLLLVINPCRRPVKAGEKVSLDSGMENGGGEERQCT